jgi:hypothetical protein
MHSATSVLRAIRPGAEPCPAPGRARALSHNGGFRRKGDRQSMRWSVCVGQRNAIHLRTFAPRLGANPWSRVPEKRNPQTVRSRAPCLRKSPERGTAEPPLPPFSDRCSPPLPPFADGGPPLPPFTDGRGPPLPRLLTVVHRYSRQVTDPTRRYSGTTPVSTSINPPGDCT